MEILKLESFSKAGKIQSTLWRFILPFDVYTVVQQNHSVLYKKSQNDEKPAASHLIPRPAYFFFVAFPPTEFLKVASYIPNTYSKMYYAVE